MNRASAYVAIFSLIAGITHAGDLGQIGRSWPVIEPDFEEVIKNKLAQMEKNGSLLKHQQEIEKRARASLERPTPVKGLTTVDKEAVRYFDPSIVTTRDMADHKGAIFSLKGTKLNPLTYMSLSKPIFLFDGEDPKQVQLARTQLTLDAKTVLIMTNGNYIEVTKAVKNKVFFDQQSQFVNRFGLTKVPVRITQAGMTLKIHELKP